MGLDDVSLTIEFATTDVSQNQLPQNQVPQNQVPQNQFPQNQDPPRKDTTTDRQSSLPDAPKPTVNPSTPSNPDDQYGKQPKRILWIIPNYRAVSANEHLPPLNFKGDLWLATQDTFDYSYFILVAGLAGIDMAGKSEPAFGQGAQGYGKYYWHNFVDGGIENYMTEAIVPAATREDPRYYTLGKGGFVKRTGYAVSRLFITRTNSGNSTFNLSESRRGRGGSGHRQCLLPARIQPLGENLPTLGNAGGVRWAVQRAKGVLARHQSCSV